MEHKHHAKSSINFLDTDEILEKLNLRGNEVFMDAGCGDGHISIKALKDYLPEGRVFAVDNYDISIKELEEYKKENDFENLVTIMADITNDIPQIGDNEIDIILMVNVVHGFKAAGNMDDVIEKLLRILKDNGRVAIVEFRPIEWTFGPPLEIKYAPDELEEIFNNHGFKNVYLTEEVGQEGLEEKSHYLIIFEKE